MSTPEETQSGAQGQPEGPTSSNQAGGGIDESAGKLLQASEPLFQELYQNWGGGEELDLALQAVKKALSLKNSTSAGSTIVIEALIIQGRYLQELVFQKGRKADAERAVKCFQTVLNRDPGNIKALTGLCIVRKFEYTFLGHRWLLEESLDLACQLIVGCSSSGPELIDGIIFASLSLQERAERDGCMDDLDVAVELLRLGKSLNNVQGDAPAISHLALAEALALRYEVAENDEDFVESKELIRKARTELPISARHTFYRSSVEGNLMRIRFLKFRQKDDMISSLRSYTESWMSTSNNKYAPASGLSLAYLRLARVLRESYYVNWGPLFLSTAHNVAEAALIEIQKLARSWESRYFECEIHTVLGEIQRSRFYKYGAPDILDDSVIHFRESAKLTDLRDARFRQRVADCCGVLRDRLKSHHSSAFQRQLDRREATEWVIQMMSATPSFRPTETVNCIAELGHLIGDFNIGSGKVEVVDRRIPHYQRACDLAQLDFSSRTDSWRNLAQTLIDKGDLTKDTKYYDTAKMYLEKIEILATECKYRATGHAPLLWRLHQAKYDSSGEVDDAIEAAKGYHHIFHESNYNADIKIEAAQRYALLIGRLSLSKDKKSKQILETLGKEKFGALKFDDAIAYALDILLSKVSRVLTRTQQLYLIRSLSAFHLLSTLATKAAGKDSFQILRTYENGRSIIWDRLINQKTQLELLEQQYPKLATRYQDLNRALESANQPDRVFSMLPRDRYQVEADLEVVVKEIRQKDGFEDFLLLPLSPTEIHNYGNQGPIVFLVAGSGPGSGFALTISNTVAKVVNLPHFSENNCRAQNAKLKGALEAGDGTVEGTDNSLYDILEWLWYKAAEPVLRVLGLLRTSSIDEKGHLEEIPRLWWVTCSWVNALPIHAAGDHRLRLKQSLPATVMDNVISSYTPTLKALKYARNRMERLSKRPSTNTPIEFALLGAMAETPDQMRLDHAIPEVEAVQTILEPELATKIISSPKLTRKSAIEHLRSCKIAHLACHGEADSHDPLRTKLLLQDYGPKPLRVGFLMRMDMANSQLAYLSACQTAVNRDEKLAEEGLHLSGAFQMAGVPNTVATSWEIDDEDAVKVAVGFYRGLKDDRGRVDVSRSARSLHGVLKDMRDRGLGPYVWEGYVHFGA